MFRTSDHIPFFFLFEETISFKNKHEQREEKKKILSVVSYGFIYLQHAGCYRKNQEYLRGNGCA